MSNSIAHDKSKVFALHIVSLYKSLTDTKQEHVLSKQLLRSGTSIGANLSESRFAISKNDFISKVYIALKEAAETQYWLDLLYKSQYVSQETFETLINECNEIIKFYPQQQKP